MFPTWHCCSCNDAGDGATYESTTALILDEETQSRPRPAPAPTAELGKRASSKAEAPVVATPEKQAYDVEPMMMMREATNVGEHITRTDEEDVAVDKVWEIHCVKNYASEELGLDMMVDRNEQLALSLHPAKRGAILRWNQAHPDQAVTAGDILESVNGCFGKPNILATMKAYEDLTFRIRRVVHFEVLVPLTSVGGLGVELRASDTGLVVEGIVDGLDVKRANSRCEAGQLIAVGNVIVKVDGEGGTPEDMARRLTNARGSVFLSIYRPSPLEAGLVSRDEDEGAGHSGRR